MRPREMEKIIMKDGWYFKNQTGGHRHYIHPTKKGKTTIPFHSGDSIDDKLEKRIRKQAGL